MRAVPKAAPGCQLCDVVEGVVETLVRVPQLQFADSRVVDQQIAAGQEKELAMGRRMPSALVTLPYGAGAKELLARQPIDQSGLAGAR